MNSSYNLHTTTSSHLLRAKLTDRGIVSKTDYLICQFDRLIFFMPYQPFLGYLKPEIFLDCKNLFEIIMIN